MMQLQRVGKDRGKDSPAALPLPWESSQETPAPSHSSSKPFRNPAVKAVRPIQTALCPMDGPEGTTASVLALPLPVMGESQG